MTAESRSSLAAACASATSSSTRERRMRAASTSACRPDSASLKGSMTPETQSVSCSTHTCSSSRARSTQCVDSCRAISYTTRLSRSRSSSPEPYVSAQPAPVPPRAVPPSPCRRSPPTASAMRVSSARNQRCNCSTSARELGCRSGNICREPAAAAMRPARGEVEELSPSPSPPPRPLLVVASSPPSVPKTTLKRRECSFQRAASGSMLSGSTKSSRWPHADAAPPVAATKASAVSFGRRRPPPPPALFPPLVFSALDGAMRP
mmetsp:Transcript_15756/g.48995  ORF Transcript_15756/g.48995 Transcript_15756/m.48995 type:complete len:263 (-) Transcript_15756:133-921(-)